MIRNYYHAVILIVIFNNETFLVRAPGPFQNYQTNPKNVAGTNTLTYYAAAAKKFYYSHLIAFVVRIGAEDYGRLRPSVLLSRFKKVVITDVAKS
jgi:hypothetical protein